MLRCLIVVPARMASTRFPGKPLVEFEGKPMIQWVFEAALSAGIADQVLVATPDREIVEAVEGFGARAILTRDDHPSGTDRLAEVARAVEAEVYVNVQGDEPLIEPENIVACARAILDAPEVEMASLYADCASEDIENPAVVKTVVDLMGNALYFSRYPIPYPRSGRRSPVKRHVGLYAFRRDTLLRFADWEPSELESTESLEQLRFLEHGVRIRMARGVAGEPGIDTPEQAEALRSRIRARGRA